MIANFEDTTSRLFYTYFS